MSNAVKRYLGADISLSSCGLAVITVKKRTPTLIAVTHVPTNAKESRGLRYEHIEHAASLFIRSHAPFDAVYREKFASPNPLTSQTVFGAWASIDRALIRFGYEVTDGIAQSSVKKTLTGSGRAEKADVAEAVRKLLRLDAEFTFGADDESDAAGVILAVLIREGVIEP